MILEDIHVGDKVRIRAWDDMEEEFGLSETGSINVLAAFTTAMEPLCGAVGTVSGIGGRPGDNLAYPNWRIFLENVVSRAGEEITESELMRFIFSPGMLEPYQLPVLEFDPDGWDEMMLLYNVK